jgi:hypothetical protein
MGLSKSYHLRCLKRLKWVINDKALFKEFLLVTYPARDGENYFPDPIGCLLWLEEITCRFLAADCFRITLCEVVETEKIMPYAQVTFENQQVRVVRTSIDSRLDTPYYHQVIACLLWTAIERSQFSKNRVEICV